MTNRVKIIDGENEGEVGTIINSIPIGREVEFKIQLDSGEEIWKKYKEVKYIESDNS